MVESLVELMRKSDEFVYENDYRPCECKGIQRAYKGGLEFFHTINGVRHDAVPQVRVWTYCRYCGRGEHKNIRMEEWP